MRTPDYYLRQYEDQPFSLIKDSFVEKISFVVKKEAISFDYNKMKNTFARVEKVLPSNGRRT